jgi:hypothetical protein|nr:MAG TPA: Putative modification methylase [Caudoviricetes sp.]
MQIEKIKISDLLEYKYNAKEHPQWQIEQIMSSIKQFGFNDPIAIDENNTIIEGHGRLYALQELGENEVECIRLSHLTEEQKKAYILAHNKLTMNTDFDLDLLQLELDNIIDIDMSEFGFIETVEDVEDDEYEDTSETGSLARDFIIPPFNIFDARGGAWNERKKLWRKFIKDNGESREGLLMDGKMGKSEFATVSLLDPILSEIVVKWFAPHKENNNIFDCFAGDTVFGFVSSYLGNNFTGIELREEQATLNQQRANEYNLSAVYHCDDGRNVLEHIEEESQDLFFSCPPYFDLEVYSDKENDASNQESYEDFYKILDEAFTNSMKALKQNRFAVVVVGDVRDKKSGGYYPFTDDIKATMKKAGLVHYNDITLINQFGSAGFRARNTFKSRKLVNVKQYVLVFYKGDTSKIKEEFEEIEIGGLEDIEG